MAGTAEAFEVAYAPGLSDASSISDGGPPDADFPSFSDDEPQGDDAAAEFTPPARHETGDKPGKNGSDKLEKGSGSHNSSKFWSQKFEFK